MSAKKRKAPKGKKAPAKAKKSKQPASSPKDRGLKLAGQLLALSNQIRDQQLPVDPDALTVVASVKATAAVLMTLDY